MDLVEKFTCHAGVGEHLSPQPTFNGPGAHDLHWGPSHMPNPSKPHSLL
jgi:hypothetical protein